MSIKKFIIFFIFISIGCLASSLVKITENEKMTIYVFQDSIKVQGNNISFKEIVDLKQDWKNNKGQEYRSHIIEETINCDTNVQTIHFMTVYSQNMGNGQILEQGVVPNNPRVIPIESQSYKTMKYFCSL